MMGMYIAQANTHAMAATQDGDFSRRDEALTFSRVTTRIMVPSLPCEILDINALSLRNAANATI
jgi:hypothetical protein